jgi:hypothetical protein
MEITIHSTQIVMFLGLALCFLSIGKLLGVFDDKSDEFARNVKKNKQQNFIATQISRIRQTLSQEEKDEAVNIMRNILKPIHESELRYHKNITSHESLKSHFKTYDQFLYAQHYFNCFEDSGCYYDDGEDQIDKYNLSFSEKTMRTFDKERKKQIEINSKNIALCKVC